MTRTTVLPFVPYSLVSLIHLVALLVGDSTVTMISKRLLMPVLILAVVIACFRRREQPLVLITIALLVSWAGDIFIGMPGDIGFLIGLGCFFLAHVTYLVLFLGRLRLRRVPWLAVGFVVWWVALLAVLAPSLGALLVPVAIYGLVLGATAAVSLACTGWVAAGGILFLVSDTILAFKFFYPGFSLWEADFVIMLLYVAAQGFIAFGATRSRVTATSRVALAV
jgi:uncharacterized membrane protein YhhN